MLVRIHDVNGTVVMWHRVRLGLPPEHEAARWEAALTQLPTIFEASAALRTPVGGAAAGLVTLAFLALRATRAMRWRRAADTTPKAHKRA